MEVLAKSKTQNIKENMNPSEMEVDVDTRKISSEKIRSQHDEYQYLDLIQKIIETGKVKGDRTG